MSSNRSLVSRVDILEVSESLVTKAEHMTMFLFNDSIEVGNLTKFLGRWITSPGVQCSKVLDGVTRGSFFNYYQVLIPGILVVTSNFRHRGVVALRQVNSSHKS